jgi:hypothetical protein
VPVSLAAGAGLGHEPARFGLVLGGDQHADAVQLKLRVLAARVVGQDGGPGTLGPATRVLPWRGGHPVTIMVETRRERNRTP